MRRWSSGLTLSLLAVSASWVFATPAGADAPTQGSIVPNAAQCIPGGPSGPCSPGPFDSGQEISVSVPANPVFAATTQTIWIFECAAPDGVLPTSPAACDQKTVQANCTIVPVADGSFACDEYIVYALPDAPTFHEGPTSTPVCGDTAATECVLYIGEDYPNYPGLPADFTQPHVFSQPFLVKADPTDSGIIDPGDGTPEVPVPVVLPAAAMGIIGGAVLIRRRRTQRAI